MNIKKSFLLHSISILLGNIVSDYVGLLRNGYRLHNRPRLNRVGNTISFVLVKIMCTLVLTLTSLSQLVI